MSITELAERHEQIRQRRVRVKHERESKFEAYADQHGYDIDDIDGWLDANRGFEQTTAGEQFEAQLEECVADMRDVYQAYLRDKFEDPDAMTKKARIIAVKKAFGIHVNDGALADALDSSAGYVKEFRYYTKDGGIVYDRMENLRKLRGEISAQTRRDVLDRDYHECVRCGATEILHLHHIRPAAMGGENTSENLATLCQSCHAEAHGSSPNRAPGNGPLAYAPATPAGFADWVEADPDSDS